MECRILRALQWICPFENRVIFGMVSARAGPPGGSVSKESACQAGDLGLIPVLGRSPGGHGDPL